MNEQAPAVTPPPPVAPTVSFTDPKWVIVDKTADWAKQQHPAWLTLWVVLFSMGSITWFGGRYIVNIAIPAHLASIKQGYEELWDKHLEDKQITETAHREHITRAVDEMRRSNELMDSLVRQFILREQRREQQQAVGAGNKAPPGDGS